MGRPACARMSPTVRVGLLGTSYGVTLSAMFPFSPVSTSTFASVLAVVAFFVVAVYVLAAAIAAAICCPSLRSSAIFHRTSSCQR